MSQPGIDPGLLAEFIDESREGLDSLDSLFVRLEADPNRRDTVDSIFRPIHSLKGNSAFFGLMTVRQVAHRMENLLDLIRKGQRSAGKASIDALLPGVDLLRRMLENVRQGKAELIDNSEVDRVLGPIQALVDNAPSVEPSSVIPASAPPSPVAALQESPTTTAANERTMRVSEQAVDLFLSYVGELVVLEEVFSHLSRELADHIDPEKFRLGYRGAVGSFVSLSSSLRDAILEIRRVPARAVLQKLPRLVRENSGRLGKQVELHLQGEDYRMDKSYADLLDAPLTHIVNNAVDHGLETTEGRIKAGKNPAGQVWVSVSEIEGCVQLEIRDDGRGIDSEAIFRKAVAAGLVSADARLDEASKLELLFLPGVSTASKVTDISGRGVGMDVVRRAINDASGEIEIESQIGVGSTFRIILPRNISTQIVDGYAVKIGSDTILLPLAQAGEAFTNYDSIANLAGRGRVLSRLGKTYRILPMGRILDHHNGMGASWLSLTIMGEACVIPIDALLGIHKVVVKPLQGLSNVLFDGVALMGDGSCSLILGEKGLKHLYQSSETP